MKVIFLDVDGVLNHQGAFEANRQSEDHSPHVIAPECVARLRRILDETGAFIVVTSSWRFDKAASAFLTRSLREHGRRIIGETSLQDKPTRAEEIQDWLNKTKEKVEKFAILDDDADAGVNMPPETFFRTCMIYGLTDACVERVIKHLGKEEKSVKLS